MDSLNLHNIKVEKANAKLRYRRLQKITALFRLMEMCIFLFVISRFTTQLPTAFKLSGEYFRGLSVTAVNPRFVFIVGNVIVVILFLKSGQLSYKEGNFPSNFKIDLYEEYVKNCEKNRNVYKEVVETNKKQRKQSNDVCRNNCNHKEIKTVKIHRSQSENLKNLQQKDNDKAGGPELRRSVTVRYRESANLEEKPGGIGVYAEDEMSSEEFRRTVEAFIARQQRFLREEEEE